MRDHCVNLGRKDDRSSARANVAVTRFRGNIRLAPTLELRMSEFTVCMSKFCLASGRGAHDVKDHDPLERNKLAATAFYDLMFNKSTLAEAIETYSGDT
jgi:hypothetical protein